jgi:hypothetical protein
VRSTDVEASNTHPPTEPNDRDQVKRVAPNDGARLPLLGKYVELVWCELLGPTTTSVAIRYALEQPDQRLDCH